MAGEEVFVASAVHTTALMALFVILWMREDRKSALKTAWVFGVFLTAGYSLMVEEFAFQVTGATALRGIALVFYQVVLAIILIISIYAVLKLILDTLNALSLYATGHRIYGEEDTNGKD